MTIFNVTGGSSGGGGGLNWTLRTISNDWTDIFTIEGSKIVALKNLMIEVENSYFFINKSYKYNSITLKYPIDTISGNSHYTYRTIAITRSNLSSSYTSFSCTDFGVQFTTDGQTVTLTNTSQVNTINKSNFTRIYVSD